MRAKYRVAVIGSTGRGNYGHRLDTAWRKIDGVEVVAVADDNEEGLAAAARRLNVRQAFRDYRKMLDTVRCDIVAVCPRWVDRHAEMAIAAAEHGCHVYMEKPFCRSPAEADAIVEACERHHVKLAVAHPTRYSPKLETVRRLIAEGRIGRLLELRGRGKEDRRGGGEDLWVLGTHVLDLMLALVGHPQWCFATVTQQGRPITAADVVEGNEGLGPLAGDAVHAVYGFSNGVVGHFDSVRNAAGKPTRYALTLYGSRGVLEMLEGTLPPVHYLDDPGWSPGRSGRQWQPVSSAGIGQPEPLTDPKYSARHTLAILDLLDAIETDRQPLCNVYEARWGVEMIAAVFESQRLSRPVQFPLKTRCNPLTLLH